MSIMQLKYLRLDAALYYKSASFCALRETASAFVCQTHRETTRGEGTAAS